MSNLANNLQTLIRDRRISIAELARQTDLNQSIVRRLATGENKNPTLETLRSLANYFSLQIDQLVSEHPFAWDIKHLVIPVISWEDAHRWPTEDATILRQEIISVSHDFSQDAFALISPDHAMEPLFCFHALLAVEPHLTGQDRDYVIVHLHNDNHTVFKQLVTDGKQNYVRSINPDLIRNMRLLEENDRILGIVKRATQQF